MGEGKDLQCGSSKSTKLYFDTPQQIGLKAVEVSCGFMHTIALSRDRMEIFSWGSGAALGLGQTNARSEIAKLVLSLRDKNMRFDSISSGFYHSVALTEMGKLYVVDVGALIHTYRTLVRLASLDSHTTLDTDTYGVRTWKDSLDWVEIPRQMH